MSKKILFVTSSRVTPAHTGGHQRSFNIARSLNSNGYEVRILSLAGRREDYFKGQKSLITTVRDGLEEYTDLSLPQGIAQTILNRVGVSRLWTYVAWPLIPMSSLSKKLFSWSDIIVYDFPFFLPPAKYRNRTSLMVSHNVESELMNKEGGFKRVLSPFVRLIEKRAAKKFSYILSCAPSDTEFYLQYSVNTIEVPNGMAERSFSLEDQLAAKMSLGLSRSSLMVMFVASSFGPNVDGFKSLRKFCRKYSNFLETNKIKFYVLGGVSKEAYSDASLTVTGFVDDITPYMVASDVIVNPVTWGSGSNIKTFEAVAAGKPILSTPFGARGLPTCSHEGLKLYESEDDMLKHLKAFQGMGPASLYQTGRSLLSEMRSDVLMDDIIRDRVLPIIHKP